MKTCNVCQTGKPAAEYHRRAKSPDGLQHTCKACRKASDAARYADPARREVILASNRQWHKDNADRCNARHKAWRARNPELVKGWARNWVEPPENSRRRHLLWSRRNRALCTLYHTRHMAKRRNSTVAGAEVTLDTIAARWAMFGGRCYICEAQAVETDHVIPLATGGLHVPANLRPVCRSCNAQKGARPWRMYAMKEVTNG